MFFIQIRSFLILEMVEGVFKFLINYNYINMYIKVNYLEMINNVISDNFIV